MYVNLEKIFKNLVIAHFVILIAAIALTWNDNEIATLNEELTAGYFLDNLGTLGYWILYGYLLLYIISLVLLYIFNKYGKYLFTFVVILSFIFLLSEPIAMSGIESALEYLMSMIDGAILTLLYFTSIKDKFT